MSSTIRQHDVVIADGTFRVVLTQNHRLFAVIDAKETLLGPVHIALEVDRGIDPELLHRAALARRGLHPQYIQVGGIFGDIGNFISKAAEGAFNTVSKVVTTVARPVFDVAKTAASHVMHGIAAATPFLPQNVRNQISAGARIVARARLGDVTAKQMIQTIAHAAKAGVAAARKAGDALLDGARLVARVADLPVQLLGKVPVVGDVLRGISPLQKFDRMTGAIQRGDFKALKEMVKEDISLAQSVATFVPFIGTGISAAVSLGMAALEGGSPLEIAVRTAYGAIPIPPGIRSITDGVLASIIEIANTGSVTDAALAAARGKVPGGLPRDVFDTLVRIIIKRVPVQKAAGALAAHYVDQYAGKAGGQVLRQAERILDPKLASMAKIALPIGNAGRVLRPIFRPIAVAGEEPIAYAVAGYEPIAGYEVAGEESEYAMAGELDMLVAGIEPVAGYEVAGEDFVDFTTAGEDPLGYDVAGEEEISVGAVLPAELIAQISRPSEWRSARSRG